MSSSDRRSVSITVFREVECGALWPSNKALDFLKEITEIIDRIPAEFRDSAEIDIGHETSYDSNYCYIEISYSRPETDDEIRKRVGDDQYRAEQIRREELSILKRLKEKYGDVT